MSGRCLHRGFPLDGNRCNYHGLTYPLDKSCFDRGECEKFEDVDRAMVEAAFNDRDEVYFEYAQKVNAPFSLWMQNAMDYRHLPHIHGMGFALLFEPDVKPYDVRISPDRLKSSHCLKVKPGVVARYEKLVGRPIPDYFFHYALFPCYSLTSFLGVFYSEELIEPLLSGGCFVETKFYTSKKNPLPKPVLDSAARANRQLLIEDKMACEKWARGYVETGNWLPGEARIRAYCEKLAEK